MSENLTSGRLYITVELAGDLRELAERREALVALLGEQAAEAAVSSLLVPEQDPERRVPSFTTPEALDSFRQRMATPTAAALEDFDILPHVRTRIKKCFRAEGVSCVGDLLALGQKRISYIHNLGSGCMESLAAMMTTLMPEVDWSKERAPVELLARIYEDPEAIPAIYHAPAGASQLAATLGEFTRLAADSHYAPHIPKAQQIISEVRKAQLAILPQAASPEASANS